MTVTLEVTKRDERGKQLANLRKEGKLPAVVYGPKEESQALTLDHKIFDKVFREAGESTIITLKGLKEDTEVLVQDVAFDPVRGGVTHVDFYAIERGKELTTNVSFEFVSEAPIEKTGATVTKVMHGVDVTCRPSLLPSHIEVDLTVLTEIDSHIQIKDLDIPEGVKVEAEPDDMVATVSAAREEEPEPEIEAVDMDAIEVEEKGKKEDGGEAEDVETQSGGDTREDKEEGGGEKE